MIDEQFFGDKVRFSKFGKFVKGSKHRARVLRSIRQVKSRSRVFKPT